MCKKLLFLISFVAVLCLVTNAFAKTIHVKVGGAYDSIEAGYDEAGTGDTIIIHEKGGDGWLGGTSLASKMKSDNSKQDITFQAAAGEWVRVIDGFQTGYKTGYTFDGFIFANSGDSYHGISTWYRAGFNEGWHTIKNCIFYNLDSVAIYTYHTSGALNSYTTVENCSFVDLVDNDAIRMKNYNYNWTIKDCIFQGVKHWVADETNWGGTAISASSGGDVYADYCTFYDNGRDVSGPDGGNAWYGTDVTTNVQVNFVNKDYKSTRFLWLACDNDAKILTGDAEGGYRGARPTPEPATIALLGLGGLALLRRRR